HHLLRDHGDPLLERLTPDVAYVHFPEEDPARLRQMNPLEEGGERALARATLPHDRRNAPLRNGKVQTAKQGGSAAIAEVHVLETDVPQTAPPEGHDTRVHLPLEVQNVEESLGGDESILHLPVGGDHGKNRHGEV